MLTAREKGIGTVRPETEYILQLLGIHYSGFDKICLFFSDKSFVAGMRIKAEYRNAGLADAKIFLQGIVHDDELVHDSLLIDVLSDFLHRHMLGE